MGIVARIRAAAALLAVAVLPALAEAQEGFPLDGTWRGEWRAPGESGTPVVIVMSWDGERINGMINPGPRSLDFDRAELEPSTWTVRIAAVDHDGRPIVIEGMLHDVGAYDRYITGTWTVAGEPREFRITRQ